MPARGQRDELPSVGALIATNQTIGKSDSLVLIYYSLFTRSCGFERWVKYGIEDACRLSTSRGPDAPPSVLRASVPAGCLHAGPRASDAVTPSYPATSRAHRREATPLALPDHRRLAQCVDRRDASVSLHVPCASPAGHGFVAGDRPQLFLRRLGAVPRAPSLSSSLASKGCVPPSMPRCESIRASMLSQTARHSSQMVGSASS